MTTIGEIIDTSAPEWAGFPESTNGMIYLGTDDSGGMSLRPDYSDADLLAIRKRHLTEAIKEEGFARIQQVMPFISSMDALEIMRELWLSIAPAARQPTDDMSGVIDVYQAARAAIIDVRSASTLAELEDYDPSAGPDWP